MQRHGQHGKRLVQKQQEWYAHEEKKINVLLATTKRLLKANKGVLEISVFLRIWFKKKVYFLDRYATKVRFLQQISSSARIQ